MDSDRVLRGGVWWGWWSHRTVWWGCDGSRPPSICIDFVTLIGRVNHIRYAHARARGRGRRATNSCLAKIRRHGCRTRRRGKTQRQVSGAEYRAMRPAWRTDRRALRQSEMIWSRADDQAFGLSQPRATQRAQRPYSSSVAGMSPACSCRCRRWSLNVNSAVSLTTRIGAASSNRWRTSLFFIKRFMRFLRLFVAP